GVTAGHRVPGRRRGRWAAPMADLAQFRMLIGGKAVGAISGREFESQNPYTGESWAVLPDGGPEDVDAAVAAARSALDGDWGQLTGIARAALLRRLGDLVSADAERPGPVALTAFGMRRP